MNEPARRIVVTGCTRGLGRALVDEFCRRGHQVFGCGRSRAQAHDLRRAHGPPHEFETVNVSDDAEVKAWADGVLSKSSPPDLVINNAAIINRNAPLWEISAPEFSSLIDINIKGVANVIRNFVPAMIRRRTGVIVNFSSGWGRSTSPEVAPYCASKWAIEGLTQALAQELPPGMAAIALNPGIINTDMLQSCFGASAESYPTADQWAAKAAPFLLQLGPDDTGKPLTAPS